MPSKTTLPGKTALPSKTFRALRYMKETGCTAAAAAKHFNMASTQLYFEINRPRCACCGHPLDATVNRVIEARRQRSDPVFYDKIPLAKLIDDLLDAKK